MFPWQEAQFRIIFCTVRPMHPDGADFLDEVSHTNGRELLLEQIQVDAQARHQFDVTVLACKTADGKWNCHPRGSTVIEPQSQLIALGTQAHLQKLAALAKP